MQLMHFAYSFSKGSVQIFSLKSKLGRNENIKTTFVQNEKKMITGYDEDYISMKM